MNNSNGCWEWQGKMFTNGYGDMSIDNKHYLAHRLSYKLFNGHIPDGLCVLHKCDNRKCVNPDHLFLGTAHDNMQDCLKKHRNNPVQGINMFNSKLDDDAVRVIRKEYTKDGKTAKRLAELFGVSTGIIYNVITNRIWKHVK
jgi:hypothetical protein